MYLYMDLRSHIITTSPVVDLEAPRTNLTTTIISYGEPETRTFFSDTNAYGTNQ